MHRYEVGEHSSVRHLNHFNSLFTGWGSHVYGVMSCASPHPPTIRGYPQPRARPALRTTGGQKTIVLCLPVPHATQLFSGEGAINEARLS
jgi:hypothetical protein